MESQLTKLDQISKTDPEIESKTSELIARRLEEEKRKAELREELRIQKAREEARLKKETRDPVPQTIPNKQPIKTQDPAPQNEDASDSEFASKKRVEAMVAGINKSFAFIEQFVRNQNAKNAKIDAFVNSLSRAIQEYNKPDDPSIKK
jgi:hypothetical protein